MDIVTEYDLREPVLPYICESSFNPIEVLKKVYHAAQPVFQQKLYEAWLYGSYARGDYDEESDVDILLTIDGDDDYHIYGWPLAEIASDLSLEYDKMISVQTVPKQRFEQYSDVLPYYRNVRKEGIRYAG